MIGLSLGRLAVRGVRILALGAHADDIEIGCGGTLLTLLASRPDARVRWVVFSAAGDRAAEARRSADVYLTGTPSRAIDVHDFRDGFLPWDGARIKEVFEQIKVFEPDLILTHRRDDAHQDHRLVADLTWNTFRSHLILEYEIPKYDGDLGSPNVFSPISPEVRRRKIEHLLHEFATQRSKPWFSEETFDALMRLRGVESASPTGYAEAFYSRKVTLDLDATVERRRPLSRSVPRPW